MPSNQSFKERARQIKQDHSRQHQQSSQRSTSCQPMEELFLRYQLVQLLKPNHTFISFDIVEFYPSITEKLLDNVILWTKSLTYIPDEHITIIKHARKSLLFYREKTWIKKNHDSLFDVTLGSYDGVVRTLNGQKYMFTYHIEGQFRFMFILYL